SSGFAPVEIDRSRRGRDGELQRRIWRVEEVRTSKELAAEGRRMNHCAYCYVWSIQKGQTSIWTMTVEDGLGETGRWAMLTIEVRKDSRRIVQARGRFNRAATGEEHGILLEWAGANGLEVSVGKW
ncbi:MAG TPA: PcfJ domain-containing protein, partial [Polyangiaceae bacterium]|nr:PcfJ domain-containing protein [Polyangiaceae bacterium]